jgi:phage host-nuclease inhibitor protein Gam
VLASTPKGKKMLLITTLLKWYMDKGLKVTKVTEVVEFCKSSPFSEFTEKVTEARLSEDAVEEKAILGDMFKIVGNAGGVKNKNEACKNVNKPTF